MKPISIDPIVRVLDYRLCTGEYCQNNLFFCSITSMKLLTKLIMQMPYKMHFSFILFSFKMYVYG